MYNDVAIKGFMQAMDLSAGEQIPNPFEQVKHTNTNWEFRSSSDEDINWADIKGSLSYAEPLALVTRKFKEGDTEKYIVINERFMEKADYVEIDSPYTLYVLEVGVASIENNFSDWVTWAKAVKAASWPDGVKSTINVTIPKV